MSVFVFDVETRTGREDDVVRLDGSGRRRKKIRPRRTRRRRRRRKKTPKEMAPSQTFVHVVYNIYNNICALGPRVYWQRWDRADLGDGSCFSFLFLTRRVLYYFMQQRPKTTCARVYARRLAKRPAHPVASAEDASVRPSARSIERFRRVGTRDPVRAATSIPN